MGIGASGYGGRVRILPSSVFFLSLAHRDTLKCVTLSLLSLAINQNATAIIFRSFEEGERKKERMCTSVRFFFLSFSLFDF